MKYPCTSRSIDRSSFQRKNTGSIPARRITRIDSTSPLFPGKETMATRSFSMCEFYHSIVILSSRALVLRYALANARATQHDIECGVSKDVRSDLHQLFLFLLCEFGN